MEEIINMNEEVKKPYIDSPVHIASRGDDFVEFVNNILTLVKLKDKFLNPLSTDKAFKLYGIALTSNLADPVNNYEYYKQKGDVLII